MQRLPSFSRPCTAVPLHAAGATSCRALIIARGALLLAALALLSACPDVKPPKDPRDIPQPKMEEPQELDMKKTPTPKSSPVNSHNVETPAGAQAGRQIGRQGQRASRQDPSMNPRTLTAGLWQKETKAAKDKDDGG